MTEICFFLKKKKNRKRLQRLICVIHMQENTKASMRHGCIHNIHNITTVKGKLTKKQREGGRYQHAISLLFIF